MCAAPSWLFACVWSIRQATCRYLEVSHCAATALPRSPQGILQQGAARWSCGDLLCAAMCSLFACVWSIRQAMCRYLQVSHCAAAVLPRSAQGILEQGAARWSCGDLLCPAMCSLLACVWSIRQAMCRYVQVSHCAAAALPRSPQGILQQGATRWRCGDSLCAAMSSLFACVWSIRQATGRYCRSLIARPRLYRAVRKVFCNGGQRD